MYMLDHSKIIQVRVYPSVLLLIIILIVNGNLPLNSVPLVFIAEILILTHFIITV